MSHLRSADELSSEYFWQEKNFLNAVKKTVDFCDKNSITHPMVHLHNSAGVYRKSDFSSFDMVRVGIAMYGYMDLPAGFDTPKLKPVMSLFAHKISSRNTKSVELIGYGGGGKISADKVTSVYDIGYSDGFLRLNEKKSYALPSGAQIIGRVSMDSMIIDSESDEICVFDDARALAAINDTITYDVLVKLSPNIPRIVS
jgi:alanine racemase